MTTRSRVLRAPGGHLLEDGEEVLAFGGQGVRGAGGVFFADDVVLF